MSAKPSTTGGNGRNASGQFARGNRFAKGNPYARRVARLRSVALRAVSAQDLEDVIQVLVARAKNGDVLAARVLLDRTLGKLTEPVCEPDRVDQHGRALSKVRETQAEQDRANALLP